MQTSSEKSRKAGATPHNLPAYCVPRGTGTGTSPTFKCSSYGVLNVRVCLNSLMDTKIRLKIKEGG